MLSDRVPGGVMPTFVKDSSVAAEGSLFTDASGELYYQLETG